MSANQKNRIGSNVRFQNRFTTGPKEITGRVVDQYTQEGEVFYRVTFRDTWATAKFAPAMGDQVITDFDIQAWL